MKVGLYRAEKGVSMRPWDRLWGGDFVHLNQITFLPSSNRLRAINLPVNPSTDISWITKPIRQAPGVSLTLYLSFLTTCFTG